MTEHRYRWQPPAYRSGDRIDFEWHKGLWRRGSVMRIETHYRHDGQAFHTYSVQADGHTTRRWVGESDMRRVPGQAEAA